MASATSSRRPDIQGLRAVAVLMVVAFHAGLPVPGGFVGVDVFFVISGFVITAMLEREFHKHGGIGLRRFYKRRFQRLTPALAVMVAVVLIVSLAILSPLGPLQAAAKTGIGALLLVANFVIARTTGGYFDLPAETNPLLHTWSLSVEEQFYLVFPFVLAGSWLLAARHRRLRHAPLLTVCGIAAVSLGLALVDATAGRSIGAPWIAGFYASFTRAWEFAAGALLALLVHHVTSVRRGVVTAAGVVGAVMLAASLWLIDGQTTFPGPWTLLPVVGTVLVLIACLGDDGPVSRALAVRPMVWIGDRSYSIYLWHWPFIVFAALLWPGSDTMLIVAAVVSLAPAVGSYAFVEQPIRTLRLPSGARFARMVAVIMVPAIVVSAGVLALTNRVLEPRYRNGDVPVAFHGAIGWDNDGLLREWYVPSDTAGLDVGGDIGGFESSCLQSRAGDPELVIVGDSHAKHLFTGFARRLPDTIVMFCAANEFPDGTQEPFSSLYPYIERTPSIRTVVVSNFWRREPDLAAFDRTLNQLVAADKSVFVTEDVPDFPFDPFRCKYKVLVGNLCSTDRSRVETMRRAYERRLRSYSEAVPGVQILPTADYFCDSDECRMTVGDDLLYRDPNHLNYRGSTYLARNLLRDNPQLAASVTGATPTNGA